MKYVIPITSIQDILGVSEKLNNLGYNSYHHWNALRMEDGVINDCIYAFPSGEFAIHRHGIGYLPGYKVVSIKDIESTIKPFQDSDDVGNT